MIDNFNKFTIKNRRKSKWKNNGFRSLYESIIPNEVIMALRDWKDNHTDQNYVLIGGLALSYYLKPRYTEDVDLIFISPSEIPKSVYKFRRNRPHSFEHIRTGVEVELLTPEYMDRPVNFFDIIFNNSIISDGIKVASPESLIALKLRRFNNKDINDIIELYKYMNENNMSINLDKYELSDIEMKNYENLISQIDDNISENLYMMSNNLNIKNNNYKKYKTEHFDVYIMKEDFGEPRFHIIKNINNLIKRFSDYQFSISITKPFSENGEVRILESSTEYNSLSNFDGLDSLVKDFISENLSKLVSDWNELNFRKIR
jgi:predicted nucleotidyltransferase